MVLDKPVVRWITASLLAAALGPACGAAAAAPSVAFLQSLADTYAGSIVANGDATGAAVAIVVPGRAPLVFTYGLADAATSTAFADNSLFEIGSVTKVFTTNLLGQNVQAGRMALNLRLGQLSPMLGNLKHRVGSVTLTEIGDFTAGFPDYAPLCGSLSPPLPGCLPSGRPPVTEYGAADFVRFFRNTTPTNYNLPKPKPAPLPVPYFYSDFSIGLLGLLLGAQPYAPMNNSALTGWWNQIQRRLLDPLGMTDTFLDVPAGAESRVVQGYLLGRAKAVVNSAGQISAVDMVQSGGAYTSTPYVTVSGGGGSGAAVAATLRHGAIASISVTAGGRGYIAPPVITFTGGGATTPATADAVIANGAIAGIKLVAGGAGYTTAPTVTITGGLAPGAGTDATAQAFIAGGRVSFVQVRTAGQGYVPKLTVTIPPGNGLTSTIPIWAPAGSLHASIRDMSRFLAAALGQTHIGAEPVKPSISAGFRIAETPYACGGSDPNLLTCAPPRTQSGLAWQINQADTINGFPAMVSKNGGLGGFSTQLTMLPAQGLGVVVFVNNAQPAPAPPLVNSKPPLAVIAAQNIIGALFYEGK